MFVGPLRGKKAELVVIVESGDGRLGFALSLVYGCGHHAGKQIPEKEEASPYSFF